MKEQDCLQNSPNHDRRCKQPFTESDIDNVLNTKLSIFLGDTSADLSNIFLIK